MRDLQSAQRAICQCDATSKSGNDAQVTQSHKPSHSQVSNSIRIGHIPLQHILLHIAKYYHLDFTILLSFHHTTSFMGEC